MKEADRAGDLVECLPNMSKAMDLIHRATRIQLGGAHLGPSSWEVDAP